MSGLNELEQRIKEKLADHQAQAESQKNQLAERMVKVDNRHQQFTVLADQLMNKIVRPRLQKLASFFDNAEMLSADQSGRHTGVCVFKHSVRFPAATRLELGLSRDGQAENLLLLFKLQILPVFFQFPDHDQMIVPLEKVIEEKAAAWFDEKIVAFLDAYLRLETLDQYQADNLVPCPVCGMHLNKLHAPVQMEYQNQAFYFCVENCRKTFAENPSSYLAVARKES